MLIVGGAMTIFITIGPWMIILNQTMVSLYGDRFPIPRPVLMLKTVIDAIQCVIALKDSEISLQLFAKRCLLIIIQLIWMSKEDSCWIRSITY